MRTTRSSIRRIPPGENTLPVAQSIHTEDESTAKENSSLSAVRADAPKIEFHGPSSILFDEDAPNQKNIQDPNGGEHHLEPLSAELMANAATQRQLESIHFSTHQFDTDGLEQDFAKEIMSLFWKTANSAFLVVYRPAFMRDWACGGPHYSKLLLNAIYHNASRHASEDSIRLYGPNSATLRARFLQRFKELLRESFDHSTTTTVQALLVMSASISALDNGRTVAWLYSGMAYRMIIDLGLHTNEPRFSTFKQVSEEDIEIQRRIFWSAFSEINALKY
ncbi:MAG: hypothetical protein ALECFALPRED_004489 [Alectoria fallacina]|uniref:Xylanolytic transcriptional activator regulatory domain-containing protein n=1 Tax=Alectoria fallacina TaxID=1903189 RepID=A0A8H3FVD5_9LECA|nr:MAG: hypothetical protein ALECFALPRED_004489 [Alectoria fallacina]